MAKTVLTLSLAVFLSVVVGCNGVDTGEGRVLATRTKAPRTAVIKIVTDRETDIVEQVVTNRQAYKQGLEVLSDYYKRTGNNMKLRWAYRELKSLNTMVQYGFIIEANVAGPELKARDSITMADYIYEDGVRMEKSAKALIIIQDDNKLRTALGHYNHVIRKYPTSDKIDDAAYRAGDIYEHFKDYSIALLYYQRAYQWDPKTPYPAKYRAAYILDQHMYRRDEALDLYRQVLEEGGLSKKRREFIEERIEELTGKN
jgi:tetratricopeptide (TPR) repeat protein